jgi:N-formylglutamate deformylase
VQLEKCWSTYMHETSPFEWDATHAARVQPLLQQMVRTMLDWTPR